MLFAKLIYVFFWYPQSPFDTLSPLKWVRKLKLERLQLDCNHVISDYQEDIDIGQFFSNFYIDVFATISFCNVCQPASIWRQNNKYLLSGSRDFRPR